MSTTERKNLADLGGEFEKIIKKEGWKEQFNFINEEYRGCNGVNQFYRFHNILVSDSIIEIAEKWECFWFIENAVILTKFQFKKEDFLCWRLIKINDEVYIVAEDGNCNVLLAEHIEYSDFSKNEDNRILEIYIENDTMILPEER